MSDVRGKETEVRGQELGPRLNPPLEGCRWQHLTGQAENIILYND